MCVSVCVSAPSFFSVAKMICIRHILFFVAYITIDIEHYAMVWSAHTHSTWNGCEQNHFFFAKIIFKWWFFLPSHSVWCVVVFAVWIHSNAISMFICANWKLVHSKIIEINTKIVSLSVCVFALLVLKTKKSGSVERSNLLFSWCIKVNESKPGKMLIHLAKSLPFLTPRK